VVLGSGTRDDPRDLGHQVRALEEARAAVASCNTTAAARMAEGIVA